MVPFQASDANVIGVRFSNYPGVDQVTYAKQEIDLLVRITHDFQIGFIVLATVMLLSALMLILNTIRMAIFARRREVTVMKLVGATNWFIRVPFMLEGLFQGFVGAAVAFVIVFVSRDDAGRRGEREPHPALQPAGRLLGRRHRHGGGHPVRRGHQSARPARRWRCAASSTSEPMAGRSSRPGGRPVRR